MVRAVAYASESASPQTGYLELKRRVKELGLLDRQPGYYSWVAVRTVLMLAACIALLFFVHDSWLRYADAILLALVSAQIGFIGHEAAHRQIFSSTRRNDALGMIAFNLLLGGSNGWWKDKHNAHHSNPNHVDHDPDIDVPVVAFSEEQAATKRGIERLIVKYQAYLILPLLSLEMLSLRLSSYRFLVTQKSQAWMTETVLIVINTVVYFGFLFALLGVWQGLLFAAIHQAVLGIYVGSVFAPNHKGMPLLDGNTQIDFVTRQVVTSRNIRSNPATDFITGGLASQIEHHLFPTMPRNNLRRAESIVKAFCHEHAIPYYETSAFQSYREIFLHLRSVSASMRSSTR